MSDEEIDNRWDVLNKRWDDNERRFAAERYAERAVLVGIVQRALIDAWGDFHGSGQTAQVAVDALIADGVVFARMGAV